jgi:hypothetical protein
LTVSDPVLLARQAQETKYIREVTSELGRRVALVPWSADRTAAIGPRRLVAIHE